MKGIWSLGVQISVKGEQAQCQTLFVKSLQK